MHFMQRASVAGLFRFSPTKATTVRYRGILALAVLAVLSAVPACEVVDRARDRFGTTDTLTVEGNGSGLVLGLQAPPMLRAGEEGLLRLTVANRSDSTVTHLRLELIVPGWVVPVPPRAGEREVTMVALADGTTRFAYRMEETPIEPGRTEAVEQRIRVPPEGAANESEVPWTRNVRGRLLRADGEALAEVESEILLAGGAAPDTVATAEIRNGRDRIGPVQLGMTAAAVRQAVPSASDTTWSQEGMSRRGVWVPLGNEGRALAVLGGDSVVRLEVRDTTFRTRERMGVGSRFDALRSAYGTPCAEADEGEVVVWFADAPGIRFALDAPVPQNVAQLRDNPDRIPDTARVTRWWLRRGGESCPR